MSPGLSRMGRGYDGNEDVDQTRRGQGETLEVKGAEATAVGKRRASTAEPLAVCVQRALEAYFADLDGEPARDLYALVVDEVEAPLLATVMREAAGNQSRAAAMLGLSRGTLRKKLKHHGLL